MDEATEKSEEFNSSSDSGSDNESIYEVSFDIGT